MSMSEPRIRIKSNPYYKNSISYEQYDAQKHHGKMSMTIVIYTIRIL